MKGEKEYYLNDFKNIAVIQTAFIGDTVLALHLCTLIKKINPNCTLTFVSAPAAATVVKLAEDVDNVIIYDKRGSGKGLQGIKNTANELKKQGVELCICLHKSLRSTLLSKYSGARLTLGFDKSALAFLYDLRVKYNRSLHEIDRNAITLTAFKDYEPQSNLEFKISYKGVDLKYINDIYDELEGEVIILAPGSVWETKKWSAENYAILAKLLKFAGYNVIIIGGKEDEETGEKIAKFGGAINLCGKTNIPQSIYAISKAKIIITNDSAPIHFAGLVGTRTFAIFGPTSPMFGFGPRGAQDLVFETEKLTCRPCAIHGGKTCPLQTHDCMGLIKPEEILAALKSELKNYI